MASILLLSPKSQGSTFILAESLLQLNATDKAASAIWQVLVLIHHIQPSKSYGFHILDMYSKKALCVVDTKLRADLQLCSIRSLFVSAINYITEGNAMALH